MEVHHHTHHDHGKKNWKEYFFEFLMLFLAVTLGFASENIREGLIHKEQVKINMQSQLSDLQSDVTLLDSVITRNAYAYKMSDSLINLLHSDISNTSEIYFAARAVTANTAFCYTNSKSFDQMKSSGILRFVHPYSLLDSMGNYYASFRWLDDLTDMLKMKLDAIHKGNDVLFDGYIFYKMMNNIAVYSTGSDGGISIINHPEGKPALLSVKPTDINNVILNYHYYAATAKFYGRRATILRERAKRLIEQIKNEYHFE